MKKLHTALYDDLLTLVQPLVRRMFSWKANRLHRRADILSRRLKRQVLIDDMHDFFAGRKTQERSRRDRDEMYEFIDRLPDDELLRLGR